MNELEKMAYAKGYIDKMANGINPLTNEIVKDDDMINNVRISRCLFYVSDILRQVIDNGGTAKKKTAVKKSDYAVGYSQLKKFPYSDEPISITEITKRLNDMVDPDLFKKLQSKTITQWLINIDFLMEVPTESGKNKKRPTEMGISVGINEETANGAYGPYTFTGYNRNAQEFIIDNLHAVCDVYMDEEN